MAFEFNGTTDVLSGAVVAANTPIAFSTWCRRDTAAIGPLISVSISSDEHAIRIQADGLASVSTTDEGGTVSAVTTSSLAIGAWHHVFAVIESSSARKIWLDGGSFGSDTATLAIPDSTSLLLGLDSEALFFLDGKMAEAAVWHGSGVETMGIAEAQILSAGYSPLCLTARLGVLEVYQPLTRDLNWNSIGSALSGSGPTVFPHPRIIYPGHEDYFQRSPGPFGNRLPPQGILPLAVNLER